MGPVQMTDETVGANKPFKDLATGLASRGIAVLRYDKPTMVHRAKVARLKDFTLRQEVIEDVLEAMKALRAQTLSDPKRSPCAWCQGYLTFRLKVTKLGSANSTSCGAEVRGIRLRVMTNRLRELRASRRWSQGDLAQELGVSRQTINAIETGKYDPSLPLAFKIARLFKRQIEDVFEDS